MSQSRRFTAPLAISLVAAASCIACSSARADLLGDKVHVTYDFPTSTALVIDSGDVTVPGTAYVPPAGTASATVSVAPASITITALQITPFVASQFNGFEFTDDSKNPLITNVTFDPLSSYAGTSGVGISFTSNQIFLNFQNTGTANPGNTAIFDLTFAPAVAATPEPGSIALLGTGLLGIGAILRRRRVP